MLHIAQPCSVSNIFIKQKTIELLSIKCREKLADDLKSALTLWKNN